MRKLATMLAAVGLAASVVAAGPAVDNSPPDGIDYELEVANGETGTVEGASGTGGTTLADNDPENCSSSDPSWMCDRVLVKFNGSGDVVTNLHAAYPIADFDLNVYESDADGTLGAEVGSSGNPPAFDETVEFGAKRGEYYLVIVYYFAAGGGYTLDVSLA